MHEKIVVNLKKNSDKAKVGIQQMENMTKQYNELVADLEKKAQELNASADNKSMWGWIVIPLTLGIGTLFFWTSARSDRQSRDIKLASAVSSRENANVATNAAAMTKQALITAIENFIEGVEAYTKFLTMTKEELEKMKNYGGRGLEHHKEMYYNAMKKHAKVLSKNSVNFLMMTDMMRTDLNAIPEDQCNTNYVDMWFEQQMEGAHYLEKYKRCHYRPAR